MVVVARQSGNRLTFVVAGRQLCRSQLMDDGALGWPLRNRRAAIQTNESIARSRLVSAREDNTVRQDVAAWLVRPTNNKKSCQFGAKMDKRRKLSCTLLAVILSRKTSCPRVAALKSVANDLLFGRPAHTNDLPDQKRSLSLGRARWQFSCHSIELPFTRGIHGQASQQQQCVVVVVGPPTIGCEDRAAKLCKSCAGFHLDLTI